MKPAMTTEELKLVRQRITRMGGQDDPLMEKLDAALEAGDPKEAVRVVRQMAREERAE